MKSAVTRRAVTVLGLLAMTTVPAFAEGSLSVMGIGGSYREAQRKAVFKTCTAENGIKMVEQE